MNLKNWFNFNYLKENIKKSKSIIILILTLVPLISGLSTLFLENVRGGAYIPSLGEISFVVIIGFLFIPFIITYALFGYVFKKRSVDFVNSMPVSRKSIFVSNTIGGILIILVMLLLNIIVMFITVKLFTNCLLPIKILLDYFVLWFVMYTFMFSVTNIAMSLSGNMITQVIVTILVLCFVPFVVDYVTDNFNINSVNTYVELSREEANNIEYYCYNNIECEEKRLEGLYNVNMYEKNTSMYNFPYTMFMSAFKGDEFKLYESSSIFYNAILTIIYIVIGYYLFMSKKMEVSETTFRTYGIHSFVKCLTMFPFVVLIIEYVFIEGFDTFLLILIALLIGYYYVYDLITKKGIQDVKSSLVYMVVFIAFSFSFTYLVNTNRSEYETFKLDDVESVSIIINDDEYILNDVKEENIIKNAIYATFNTCNSEYVCEYAQMNFRINGKNYESYVNVISGEYYDKLRSDVIRYGIEDKVYKIDYDDALVVSINGILYDIENHSELIKLLKNDKSDGENLLEVGFAKIYYYENHEIKVTNVRTSNEKIANYLGVFSNNIAGEVLKKIDFRDNFLDIYHDEYEYSNDYLIEYYKEDVIKYLKSSVKNTFDSSKDYIRIYIDDYANGKNAVYLDNDVEGFYELLDSLKEKAKDNLEYQEYLENYYGWGVEDEVTY